MTISAGVIRDHIDGFSIYGAGQVNWDRNELSGFKAKRAFRECPEAVLAGNVILSVESESEGSRMSPVVEMALVDPERFVELVSFLPALAQDILFQHYLLGRTYAQIGLVLFPNHARATQTVEIGHRLGVRALCAIIKCRGNKAKLPKRGPLAQAWERMFAWHPVINGRMVELKAAHDLGDFVIAPNGQLGELFAPAWSAMGPRRRL